MSQKPFRKKLGEFFDTKLGATAVVAATMLGTGTGLYTLTGDEMSTDHSEHREEVMTLLDQRFDRLDRLNAENSDLKHQFDIAKLKNNLNQRHDLEEDLEENTHLIRWLSQEYASVLLQSEALNEHDFAAYAQRFQDSGFDDYTGITIDPDHAEWRDEMRERHLPLNPKFEDFLEMSEAMDEAHSGQMGATIFLSILAAFPGLFLSVFVESKTSPWRRMPDKPQNPQNKKTSAWRRRHNH